MTKEMEIEEIEIRVRDVVDEFTDRGIDGVTGWRGSLDIRPAYQREFVYGRKDEQAVVSSVMQGYRLGIMYWTDRGEGMEPRYEVLDGQQRIMSLGRFYKDAFEMGKKPDTYVFEGMSDADKEKFLDHRLLVFACRGTDNLLMDWFERINIVGKSLTPQEIRNAVHHGPMVDEAKRRLSVKGAKDYYGKYMKSRRYMRQEILETVMEWSVPEGSTLKAWMGRHKKEKHYAVEIDHHGQAVVEWVEDTFGPYSEEMGKVEWGRLHRQYADKPCNPDRMAKRAAKLRKDPSVTCIEGIYEYLLSGQANRKYLNARFFDPKTKKAALKKQGGKCGTCKKRLTLSSAHADHIRPWSKGGPTTLENCQALCADCNKEKSDK